MALLTKARGLTIAALATVLAAIPAAYALRERGREVRLAIVNERAGAVRAVHAGDVTVAQLAPGATARVAFAPVSLLTLDYVDDTGAVHRAQHAACFGECTYWPPCSAPVLRIGEGERVDLDDGPAPSRFASWVLGCDE